MATPQERKTPRAIEPPKPEAPPTPTRERIYGQYPTGAEHSTRNPDAVTSVTVIVTYADRPTTSETFTSYDLAEFRIEREVVAPNVEAEHITLSAWKHYRST